MQQKEQKMIPLQCKMITQKDQKLYKYHDEY